jgi:toxin FitB
MNVVDSSAWLEYFADGPNATFFAQPIEQGADLIVPSISLYEVFKHVLQQRTESEALQAVAVMLRGQVVDLDADLALGAARISAVLRLPMADSIILATARACGATLYTQDEHFDGVADVQYISKRPG